jgi:hypothetical protein
MGWRERVGVHAHDVQELKSPLRARCLVVMTWSADALAARSASPVVDQAAAGRGLPGFVAAPTVRHSGNNWAARNALRNAEVSASPITNRGLGRNRTTPAQDVYRTALSNDAALLQAEPAMQQDDANSRTMIQGMQAQQRLAMDRETQGIANRARP